MTDNQKITDAVTTQNQFGSSAEEPRIAVHKIYTKGQQFIVNGLPDELAKNWNPQLSVQANPRITQLESGQHEVVLSFNLSAQQLGKAIFQIQLDQAGLFTLQDVPAEQKEAALFGACSNALFPYVSVMINQALSQAGLPHLYLNPMDFIALYREHKKQEQEKSVKQVEAEAIN